MYAAREQLIRAYIAAYNAFDVDQMLACLAKDVLFENIQDGEVTLSLKGLAAFRQQAAASAAYFSEREQTILALQHHQDRSEAEIAYRAVLATDLPNGMKKGAVLQLTGKSVFVLESGKIKRLTDRS